MCHNVITVDFTLNGVWVYGCCSRTVGVDLTLSLVTLVRVLHSWNSSSSTSYFWTTVNPTQTTRGLQPPIPNRRSQKNGKPGRSGAHRACSLICDEQAWKPPDRSGPRSPKTSNRESAAAFLGPRLTGIDLIGQCCLTVYERGEPLEGCASKMWCSHIWKFCDWKDLWVRVSGFVPRLFLGWWVDWWSKQSFLHANGSAKLEVKFSLTWVSLTSIACSLNVALNVNARNI